MLLFVVVGVVGLALLVFSLVFDDLLGDFLDTPFLSSAAVGGFGSAFGFAGLLVDHSGAGTWAAVLAGLAAGAAMGGVGYVVSRAMHSAPTSDTPSMATVVGASGAVTVAVPTDGLGEVAVHVGSTVNRYSARSATPLPVGTPVTVTAAISPTSVHVAPTTA